MRYFEINTNKLDNDLNQEFSDGYYGLVAAPDDITAIDIFHRDIDKSSIYNMQEVPRSYALRSYIKSQLIYEYQTDNNNNNELEEKLKSDEFVNQLDNEGALLMDRSLQ